MCNHKLSKAERAFAVYSSGRENKKWEETSAFVSMQVQFITRIWNHNKFSPVLVWAAPLLGNRLLWGVFTPKARQVSFSLELSQLQRPLQSLLQTNSPNLLFKTLSLILLQPSSAVRHCPAAEQEHLERYLQRREPVTEGKVAVRPHWLPIHPWLSAQPAGRSAGTSLATA